MYYLHKFSADIWFLIGRIFPKYFDQCEKNAEWHIVKMAKYIPYDDD